MATSKSDPSAARAAFITAMRSVAASVCVVTTNGTEGRRGATVSAFCSVSADPPTILVCLNAASQIAKVVAAHGVFNVNILRTDQTDVANRFAGVDDAVVVDRFDGIACSAAVQPEITGAMVLCCHTANVVAAGSHQIFIAEVTDIKGEFAPPLAYLDGTFHALVPTPLKIR
jgi:flavin reductase (DIM6/NTAB) family NADH-FMN oxidoreductase RutF